VAKKEPVKPYYRENDQYIVDKNHDMFWKDGVSPESIYMPPVIAIVVLLVAGWAFLWVFVRIIP
jgi:hypothetical protein